MHYTTHVDIDLPVDRVIELFDNPDNMKHWQPELVSFDHLEGEPGMPGAKSRLTYKRGKREFSMIETMHTRNLPQEMTGSYSMPGVENHIRIRFETLGDAKTRLISESTFEFKAFGMKVMSWLMPGAFKKQTQKYLDNFKTFAEAQG